MIIGILSVCLSLALGATPSNQTFIDTDRNSNTGYGPKGHEYVIREGLLYGTWEGTGPGGWALSQDQPVAGKQWYQEAYSNDGRRTGSSGGPSYSGSNPSGSGNGQPPPPPPPPPPLPPPPTPEVDCDLNDDGVITLVDFQLFQNCYQTAGPPPPPPPPPPPSGCQPGEWVVGDEIDIGPLGNWIQTGSSNSLTPIAGTFDTAGSSISTTSTATNIHCHSPNGPWINFEYTGRMMIDHSSGGIGITWRSKYPQADQYYRLRRGSFTGGESFHFSPHGTGGPAGSSNLNPQSGKWYRFRVQIADAFMTAKVWLDGDPEPNLWLPSGTDVTITRIDSGTVGVWSMGPGKKSWADLKVTRLELCE